MIFIIFVLKYKPMYKVTLEGNVIGYVTSKKDVEKIINDYTSTRSENIASVELKNMPQYDFNLVNWNKKDETEQVLKKIKEESIITYKLYSIRLGEEYQEYVSTMQEAEQVIADLKDEFEDVLKLDITIEELYTSDLENIKSIDMQIAKANLDTKIVENCDSAINGVVLSKPLKGIITSRYGTRDGRQHMGLDIAANEGTPIYACSKGKVEYVGNYYGYGNLIIINHGNGIQTYYGHCSKIYVSKGQEVTNNTIIGAVGSTGNSTGPHLHLEIRKNGVVQNPQSYLYK